jgi:hypothetical protein
MRLKRRGFKPKKDTLINFKKRCEIKTMKILIYTHCDQSRLFAVILIDYISIEDILNIPSSLLVMLSVPIFMSFNFAPVFDKTFVSYNFCDVMSSTAILIALPLAVKMRLRPHNFSVFSIPLIYLLSLLKLFFQSHNINTIVNI